MPLTPEQLEMRRTGITSTDMSAILGLNDNKSAMEVYLDKIGKPIPREQTKAMWWGNALEDDLIARYAEGQDGIEPWGETVRGVVPWMLATPDACVWSEWGGTPRLRHRLWGVELKTAGSAKQVARWGPSRGAILPEEYLVQCCWCMAVCNLDRWDVIVFLAAWQGLEDRQYTITRDLALEAKLIEIGREFWTKHVLKGAPPPPDGSGSAHRALAHLHPLDETPIMPADDESEGLVNDLWIAKQDYEDADREFERCKQALKAEITTAEGIQGKNFRVTWKANKRGSRVFRYSGKLFRQKVEVDDGDD